MSDEEVSSTEDIKKAYREMYNNWLKICNVKTSLKDKIIEINEENIDLKSTLVNLKILVKEKDEKIQEITVDLEGIKKNLRMLNFGTTKLDQVLNMGQSMNNRSGIGWVLQTLLQQCRIQCL